MIGFNGRRCANGIPLQVGGQLEPTRPDCGTPLAQQDLILRLLNSWSYEARSRGPAFLRRVTASRCPCWQTETCSAGSRVNPTYGPTTRIARSTDHRTTLQHAGDHHLGRQPRGTHRNVDPVGGRFRDHALLVRRRPQCHGPILRRTTAAHHGLHADARNQRRSRSRDRRLRHRVVHRARSTDGGLTWRNAVRDGLRQWPAPRTPPVALLVRLNGKLAMFARTWVFDVRTNNITVVTRPTKERPGPSR